MGFEERQKDIISFFKKQKQDNKIIHAYLLSGGKDSTDLSRYMAMSLLCENREERPCYKCDACQQVLTKQHPNYIYIDGKTKSIKKEEIDRIEDTFSQTSQTRNPYKVYILDGIEAAGHVAMNRLLKFLEEPSADVVAILTCQDENKVLETIKSRCLRLVLNKSSEKDLIEEYEKQGIEKLDAYILAGLSLSDQEAQLYFESQEYRNLSNAVLDFLDLAKQDLARAAIALQLFVQKETVLSRQSFVYFINTLIRILWEYDDEDIKLLHKDFNHLAKERMSHALIKAQDRFGSGINLGLLVDQLAYALIYGEDDDDSRLF